MVMHGSAANQRSVSERGPRSAREGSHDEIKPLLRRALPRPGREPGHPRLLQCRVDGAGVGRVAQRARDVDIAHQASEFTPLVLPEPVV